MVFSRQVSKFVANTLIGLMLITPLGVPAVNAAETEIAQDETTIRVDKPDSGQTATAGSSFGNESLTDKEKPLQFGNSLLAYYLENGKNNGPKWLKTTAIQFSFTEDHKPAFSFETIQPLSEVTGEGPLWFWQGRYAHRSKDTTTANLGLGWRLLSKDKSQIFGLNAFYDYGFQYNLSRIGIGTEYFNKLTECRINYYIPLSGDRQTGASDLGNGLLYNYIRAVRGIDYEIGTSLEQARWLSIFATGFNYANKYSAAETGYRLRGTMQLTPRFSVEMGYENSNLSKGAFYGKISYQLADCLKPSLFGDNNKHAKETKDISYKLLQKVERDNDIKTEKFSKFVPYSGNLGVTVTNTSAQPIQGALVQAYQNGSQVGAPVATGVTGIGVITGLNVGTYTVKATYFGHTGDSTGVSVQKDQSASATIVLPVIGAGAVVRVLNSQAQPVSGIAVTARSVDGQTAQAKGNLFDRILGVKTAFAAIAPFEVTTTTGSDGNAHFNNLPPGNYYFSVTVNGQTMSTVSVPISQGNTSSAEIVLTSGGANTSGASIKVTDGTNPIRSATVTCGSVQATTNHSGVAVLTNIPIGNQTFSVSKTDYADKSVTVNIVSGTTATATVALTRQTGNASITVTDGTSPISGATVSVTVNGAPKTAVTDGAGVAAFANLPTGTYTFTATMADYTNNTVSVAIAHNGTGTGTIQLTRQTGNANIKVTDGANPIGGATVSVTVNGASLTATTNGAGVATFANLPTGTYTFTAAMTGYTTNTFSVAIAHNGTGTGTIQLTRQTGNANITVTDGMSPLSGATVSVTVNGVLKTATTSGAGVASFANLPTGTYIFTATMTDYIDRTVSVAIAYNGTGTGTIPLTRKTGNANITVTDGTTPLAGAMISITINGNLRTIFTNGSGVASVSNLPTGTYTFTASMTGYTNNTVSVTVDHNGTGVGTVQLTRQTGNADITVTDGIGPISGATVSATVNGVLKTTTTNGAGVAAFANLPTGTYTFTATMAGYTSNTVTVAIAYNGTGVGTIPLARQTGNADITVNDGIKPISGATVSVTVNGASQTVITNGAGLASFANLPTGTYTFTVTMAGYTSNTVSNVVIDPVGTIIALIPLTRQTGNANIKVTDGTNPISGATVSVTVNGTPQTSVTDGTGVAAFANLPTGTYTFTASMAGYNNNVVNNVSIPFNGTGTGTITLTRQTGNATIFVNPGGAVSGAGATVSVTVNGVLKTAVADFMGIASFSNIPTGTYTFTAKKAGCTDGKTDVTILPYTTVTSSVYFNPEYGNANITVTDGTHPISGASVRVTVHGVQLEATTNSSGVASFANIQAGGTYTFTASMDSGYTSSSVNVTIPSNATGAGSIILVPAITVKLHFVVPPSNHDHYIIGALYQLSPYTKISSNISNIAFDTGNIIVPANGTYQFAGIWSYDNGDGTRSTRNTYTEVRVSGSGTYNVVF